MITKERLTQMKKKSKIPEGVAIAEKPKAPGISVGNTVRERERFQAEEVKVEGFSGHRETSKPIDTTNQPKNEKIIIAPTDTQIPEREMPKFENKKEERQFSVVEEQQKAEWVDTLQQNILQELKLQTQLLKKIISKLK